MASNSSVVQTLYWHDDTLSLLDQTRLPHSIDYVTCRTAADVAEAISSMVVRGAPAIGVAAAFGVVLAARDAWARNTQNWRETIESDLAMLRAARPTAVNLAWAIDRMGAKFDTIPAEPYDELLQEAHTILEQDVAINEKMGAHGATLIAPDSVVITHCNAGALATAGYGTALGVIRSAWAQGKISQVYAPETRPWMQGCRLTAWELQQDGIPVKIITDSAAAHLMNTEKIDWVITGADRIAANGDVANKIGTYSLAVNARAHGVRFMVAAPLSTIDFATACGRDIPIEEREEGELLTFRGERVAAPNVCAFNPVFDITPTSFVDVLATELGVLERPDKASIAQRFGP